MSFSYRYTLARAARWAVRLRRTDAKLTAMSAGDELRWDGLRAFLGPVSYGGITVLAVKIAATASVNDSMIGRIAVTATRKLPVWEGGTAWSAPSDALHRLGSGRHAAQRDLWRGAAAIPVRRLGAVRDVCGVDVARRHLRLLRHRCLDAVGGGGKGIARGPRPALPPGRHGPVLPRLPGGIPAQLFSAENIAKGSLRMSFLFPAPDATTDGIELKYFDGRVWNFATIRRARFRRGRAAVAVLCHAVGRGRSGPGPPRGRLHAGGGHLSPGLRGVR